MTRKIKALALVAIAAIVAPIAIVGKSQASDHADTPELVANPGADLTDLYIFPSPQNANNVVFVMNVRPLIKPGEGGSASFDPNVLYQFKLDNTGDAVEDLVIQAKFTGTGANQTVAISGPVRPSRRGTTSVLETPYGVTGRLNETFSPTNGMKVFAGAREDSFFFDLEQFFKILPDRATPLTGQPVEDPNRPRETTFRAPGEAVDFFSNGGFNVLSIVVEVPKSMIRQ